MTKFYCYYESKNGYGCDEVKNVVDDIQNKLWEVQEQHQEYTPYELIHDESELPEVDDDENEGQIAALAACQEYLEGGGTYPFYLVTQPNELSIEDRYECWEINEHWKTNAYFTGWDMLLGEYYSHYNTGESAEYFESCDVARKIRDAIDWGDDCKAAAIIAGVYIMTDDDAEEFLKALKAANDPDELKEIVSYNYDSLDVVYRFGRTDGYYPEWEELPAEDDWKDSGSYFCGGVAYFSEFLSEPGNEKLKLPAKENGQVDWDNLDEYTEQYGWAAWLEYCKKKEQEEIDKLQESIRKAIENLDAEYETVLSVYFLN